MDDVITGDGWAVSNLDRLGRRTRLSQDPHAAGRDRLWHERDRAAGRHRDRPPRPRAPGGGLLPARRAHRDRVRRRRHAAARARWHRARRPVDGAPHPQRGRRPTRSTSSSAAPTATSGATGSSPGGRRAPKRRSERARPLLSSSRAGAGHPDRALQRRLGRARRPSALPRRQRAADGFLRTRARTLRRAHDRHFLATRARRICTQIYGGRQRAHHRNDRRAPHRPAPEAHERLRDRRLAARRPARAPRAAGVAP